VDFPLQIDAQRSIRSNDLVRADSRFRRYVATRIGNAHIAGIVTDSMTPALNRRIRESVKELFALRFD
jgi:hypothetical protein